MALLEQIQKDMVQAMKTRDEPRLGTVRMIKAALKKHEIDSMKPLDEATELQVMSTLIKQRREAADLYRKGNRPDLADKEEAELKLIESYLSRRAVRPGNDCRHRSGARRNGGNQRQTDGAGDEGSAGETGRETRGREGAERESESAAGLIFRMWPNRSLTAHSRV